MTAQMQRESARYHAGKVKRLLAAYIQMADIAFASERDDDAYARTAAWADLENYLGTKGALAAWTEYRREQNA